MRSGPAATAALLLALAPILSACGDEQTTAAGSEKASSKATTGEAKPATNGARSSDPAAGQCRKSLGDFLDSIESLNNSLAVGLSYDDYLDAVNHVRSTYAAIQVDRLPIVCLANVAGTAEQALNLYIAAANTWGDCLATTACSPESVEPKLQRRWAGASDLISETQSGLRDLR